jgi:hypothetical protein
MYAQPTQSNVPSWRSRPRRRKEGRRSGPCVSPLDCGLAWSGCACRSISPRLSCCAGASSARNDASAYPLTKDHIFRHSVLRGIHRLDQPCRRCSPCQTGQVREQRGPHELRRSRRRASLRHAFPPMPRPHHPGSCGCMRSSTTASGSWHARLASGCGSTAGRAMI